MGGYGGTRILQIQWDAMIKAVLKILLLAAYTLVVFFNTNVSVWSGLSAWDLVYIGQPIEEVRASLGQIHAGAGFVDDWQIDFKIFDVLIFSRGIEVSYDMCADILKMDIGECDDPESHRAFVSGTHEYWGLLGLFWYGHRVNLDQI